MVCARNNHDKVNCSLPLCHVLRFFFVSFRRSSYIYSLLFFEKPFQKDAEAVAVGKADMR